MYYGTISGTDDNAETEASQIRNLNFRSNILDIGGNLEWNIMGFESGSRDYIFSPYLFGGLSIFKFDPEAYCEACTEEYIRLQPLGTEGQGTTLHNERVKYALTQVSIPFGAGFKFNFASTWNLGFELGWRKTFTDYLDDVSTTYPTYEVLTAESGALAARLSHRYAEIGGENVKYGLLDEEPRGNPTNMDWFMFTGITLTYTIMPPSCYKF